MIQDQPQPERRFSRRSFIQKLGAAGAAAGILAACGGESGGGAGEGTVSCNDTSGLSQPAVQMRQSLGYIEKSVAPQQWCHNCAFWQAPAEGTPCGGCTLIQGPINPDGWCRSWAAKPVEGA